MNRHEPAEVFPPGDHLREELDARGWTQADFAEVTGIPSATISDILGSKLRLSVEAADRIGKALGTGPKVWLNLDNTYRLSKLRRNDDDDVSRRARMYELAPIKEMFRRGWLEPTESVDVLEAQVKRFYGIESLDDEPDLPDLAAKKSTSYTDRLTPLQKAWVRRTMQLARAVSTATYSQAALDVALDRLRQLLHEPRETRHVAKVLADAGIHLVVVQPLPGSKIDGATFWLADEPVIALSLRFDRIDNFWFVLLHELDHVRKGVPSFDNDLLSEKQEQVVDAEAAANAFASGFLIPPARLESFITRTRPLYSMRRIEAFAQVQQVHPAIVVGQLQHRGELAYRSFRQLLVPVRDWVTAATVTDGWGTELPAQL